MLTGKKYCEATILKQYYTRINIGQMKQKRKPIFKPKYGEILVIWLKYFESVGKG